MLSKSLCATEVGTKDRRVPKLNVARVGVMTHTEYSEYSACVCEREGVCQRGGGKACAGGYFEKHESLETALRGVLQED